MLKKDELNNPNSCINKAKDDEMVFVLLARDPAAPAAIAHWQTRRIKLGMNEPTDEKMMEASKCITEMLLYQKARGI